MLRIFLADDHAIVRQGLRKLIEQQPDLAVVGEAGDGRQVLLAEGKERWDVLILDLSLPRVNGIEVLRRLRAEQPKLRIIVLSMYPEEQYGLRMMDEGASAYLSKEQPADDLLTAIRVVGTGGTYMSKEIAARARAAASADPGQPLHRNLTAREHQVFTLLFQGSTVSEIAAELDISVSTTSNHVSRIKEKLGAHSIGEIVNYAHRAGLVGSFQNR